MIPDLSDPRWKRVLTSNSDLSSASLATRILISRLRQVLEPDPSAPRYIQTVWGRGYMFVPDQPA